MHINTMLTRLTAEIEREIDGDSIARSCIGDVTVEFVCVGVNITDGFPGVPLPVDMSPLE
jgi:hypothetical protein